MADYHNINIMATDQLVDDYTVALIIVLYPVKTDVQVMIKSVVRKIFQLY